MMWPFTKKEVPPKEIDPEALREFLKEDRAITILRGYILAKGGEIRRACTLKEKLIANRMYRQKGKGDAYWESVIEIIEKHYKKKAD